jgi:NADH:ubiquinone oxidoreductase subunit 3 (subunit A)
MTEDLVLDSRIRDWVLLPIALVMFLIAILRNNISLLLHSERKPELQKVQERYPSPPPPLGRARLRVAIRRVMAPLRFIYFFQFILF